MGAAGSAQRRLLNLVAFSGLCLIAGVVWDIFYAALAAKLPVLLPGMLAFWVAPSLLCAGLGYVLGQWRQERSAMAKLGAAVWCLVIPVVAFVPFALVMCSAFGECLT